MVRQLVRWCACSVLLGAQGSVVFAQREDEKFFVKLTDEWVQLVGEDTMASFPLGDSSVVDREAFPIFKAPIIPPKGRSPREYVPIVVNAHVTKRGNVKRAWIVNSGSPFFNKAVLKSIVQWKFSPRIVNHLPQDTILTLEIPLPRKLPE